jgi:hypothetical protein
VGLAARQIGPDRTSEKPYFSVCIEPVFWTGADEQSRPADDFVQAEALQSV